MLPRRKSNVMRTTRDEAVGAYSEHHSHLPIQWHCRASRNERSISVSESGSSALPTANREQCDGVEKNLKKGRRHSTHNDSGRMCPDEMISSLLLRITSSWPVCASFSALRLLLFLIGGSNETGDPQEERLCWILTLRSAIQVRQDTEIEPDEMLSMRRQASEQ